MKKSELKQIIKEEILNSLNEASTDYMKRRGESDDYKVSKKDKPSKSSNPNYSGKTDYMKRREKDLNENEISLDNLDTYIIKNRDSILSNLDTYGFDVEDVPNMRNYIDVASVLGLDSRLFKEVDLQYVTDMMYDILRDEEF